MSISDDESAAIVNTIVEQYFKGKNMTRQDIDKILADLQTRVASDFLQCPYPVNP